VAILSALAWLAIGSAQALAQIEGSIEVSAQPIPHICSLIDTSPGIRTVYVFHTFNVGATASRFKIHLGTGVTMTFVSETHPFQSTVGNTQEGITVCYGGCLAGDQLLATINYMAYATSAACSQVLVVPHPAAQTVEAMTCEGIAVRTFVNDMFVETGTSGCGCPEAHGFAGTAQQFDCTPTPVAHSTWGAIKALYRN
jgi:hypothetical protein